MTLPKEKMPQRAPRNPGRGGPFHPDAIRKKLRAVYYISQLHKHIEGKIELKMSQIRAIEILLRKCVPDLTTTAILADITHRYVVELPQVLDKETWERKYGPNATLQ